MTEPPAPLPESLVTAVLGCLLHDVGKPVQRAQLGYRGKHAAIGRAFLKKAWLRDSRNPSEFDDDAPGADSELEVNAHDREILDAVSYHHGAALRTATEHGRLATDAPAYIAYIADNIAAGTDRRKADSDADADGAAQWTPRTPLYSVFNRFGDGVQQMRFAPELLDDREPINYPDERDIEFDAGRYTEIALKLEAELKHLDRTGAFAASVLNVLEATCSFVPSSTDTSEVVDISLFDHLKLTAAIGSCIWHYLADSGRSNYRRELFERADEFYAERAFLLVTFDLSGIQDFIYTIHSSGAAKMLRARSFYLEMLTEHLIDEIFARVALTRANLNYSGGGHAYLLLPNTAKARRILDAFARETNDWLVANFGPRIFFAHGSVPLAATDLMRRPGETPAEGQNRAERYAGLYRALSDQVSARKLARYDADQLRVINAAPAEVGGRECRVCHAVSTKVNADGLCPLCRALTDASPRLQDSEYRYLVITRRDALGDRVGLPLPFDCSLSFAKPVAAAGAVEDGSAVRVYAKNKFAVGQVQGTRLWIADYVREQDFSAYAHGSGGIERIGVLRLDVDNLGTAFTRGFMAQGDGRYNTISRTAAFSRMLSVFFRQHINYLLEHPTYRPITGGRERSRNATIIYSGGDDLFVVGSWDDIVEFAVEFRERFGAYTQGKLTASAGIGMYPDKYPIAAMARETGDLEAAAKAWRAEKDAVALFDPSLVFPWDRLRDDIIAVKYRHLADFFAGDDEHGKAFIYRLLTLLGQREDRISHARWVYLLARMRDSTKAGAEFQEFTNQLHRWFQDPREAQRLKVALYLYVYSVRDKENA